MRISNWSEWQSFRKDRGAPPWIKLHRNLLTNKKWAVLTDAEKGQLVSLWIIAGDSNGEIPDDPAILRKICQLDQDPNVSKFIELGLLTPSCQPNDNQMTTTCQPNDAPEQSRAEQSRAEQSILAPQEKMDFDTFMSVYPNRCAVEKARVEWLEAIKKEKPETIINAASAYAERMRLDGTSLKWIPSPEKWLKAQAWKNETTNNSKRKRVVPVL